MTTKTTTSASISKPFNSWKALAGARTKAAEADAARRKRVLEATVLAEEEEAVPPILRRHENASSSRPGAYSIEGPIDHHHEEDSMNSGTTDQEEEADTVLVTAAEVTEDQVERLEREIRSKILQESVLASPVSVSLLDLDPQKDDDEGQRQVEDPPKARRNCPRTPKVGYLLVILGLVVTGLMVRMRKQSLKSSNESHSTSHLSVLEAIRKRGHVRCGFLFHMPGFASLVPTAQNKQDWKGINVDQCRALSVAVFGKPQQFQMVELNSTRAQTLAFLANQTVDVLTDSVMHTMDRDRPGGFTFSTPYLYAQGKFAGVPEYVECADQMDSFTGNCRQVKICFSAGSVSELVLQDLLPGSALVPFHSKVEWIQKWNQEECNVILANTAFTTEDTIRSFGYQGPYATGTKVYASGPLALVTREQDKEWSNIVNLMVQTLFWAEANNITQYTPVEAIVSQYFPNKDEQLAQTMASMIYHIGHYGQVYQRDLESVAPREGLNQLDTPMSRHRSGLLYTLPFGALEATGSAPTPQSTLGIIQQRGFLKCGVHPILGFAIQNIDDQWEGMDVDLCRAIAAAIFEGNPGKIEFINMTETGHYAALSSHQVDVAAGVPLNIQATYKEPSADRAFAFSRPYHFEKNHNASTHTALALMTQQKDSQWSDFVFWIVNCLLHAEEQGIHQNSSIQMPLVSLFGENLKQMFLYAVHAVGSYEEVYQRNLEAIAPRAHGRNFLNSDLSGSQHYALPIEESLTLLL